MTLWSESMTKTNDTQSNEGKDYKTWLIYPNGDKLTVRRDSAEKVCEIYDRQLIFGEHLGIRWRY